MSKKSVENEEKLDIEISDGPVENATDEIVVEQEVIEEEKPEEERCIRDMSRLLSLPKA